MKPTGYLYEFGANIRFEPDRVDHPDEWKETPLYELTHTQLHVLQMANNMGVATPKIKDFE